MTHSLQRFLLASLLTVAAALFAPSALAAPVAAEQEVSTPKLRVPVVVDGVRHTAEQMRRFAGKRLYYVMGRKESARGVAVAFSRRSDRRAYLRKDGRLPRSENGGVQAANYGESTFYEHAFLRGASFSLEGGDADANLARRCFNWWCGGGNWNDKISSVRSGDRGATLYEHLWFEGANLYVPPYDSAEIWKVGFNDRASSVSNR